MGCENASMLSATRHVDRTTFRNHQHPKGHPCNPAMHMETSPNRPKPGTHDAAAQAQIVTTLGDALPVCVWYGLRHRCRFALSCSAPVCMAWTTPRTPPQPPGQAQQMQAGRQAGPTTGPTQAAGDGHRRQAGRLQGRTPSPSEGRTEPHRGRTAPARQDCREHINSLITLTT